jgi:hypothetical protein
MMIMQQTTTVAAILPLLLVLTATRVVNNTTVPPGDNYSTGYSQVLRAYPKIILRYTVMQQDRCTNPR